MVLDRCYCRAQQRRTVAVLFLTAAWLPDAAHGSSRGIQWARHVIDNSSQGADGIRLADVNGDGLLDIATGWEEGGFGRAYINPGFAASRNHWPYVTVG